MDDEMYEFLKEGMSQYRTVRSMINAFNNEITDILQNILKKKRDWGQFKPEIDKIKSTNYGKEYPALNALLPGLIGETEIIIEIAIIWYDSKGEYPYYVICFKDYNDLNIKFENYVSKVKELKYFNSNYASGLWFEPDSSNFDLSRDFNFIIENFIKSISE